jgi:hypothetical protein
MDVEEGRRSSIINTPTVSLTATLRKLVAAMLITGDTVSGRCNGSAAGTWATGSTDTEDKNASDGELNDRGVGNEETLPVRPAVATVAVQETEGARPSRPRRSTARYEEQPEYVLDDLLNDDILEVRPSLIPDAGRGLFVLTDVEVGTVLANYTGNRITEAIRRRAGYDSTYVAAHGNNMVDALDQRTRKVLSKAAYSNDPFDAAKVNCRFDDDDRDEGAIVLRAIRPIMAGEEIYVEYGAFYWCQDCFGIELQLQAIRAYKVNIQKKGKQGDWRTRVTFEELRWRLKHETEGTKVATVDTGSSAAVVTELDRERLEGVTTDADEIAGGEQDDAQGEGTTAKETHETDTTHSAGLGADTEETEAEQTNGTEEGATREDTAQPTAKTKRLRQPTLADYLPSKRLREHGEGEAAVLAPAAVGEWGVEQKRAMGVPSTRGGKGRAHKKQKGRSASQRPDAATRRKHDIESYMAHQRARKEWIVEEETAEHGTVKARVTDMACILTRADSADRGSRPEENNSREEQLGREAPALTTGQDRPSDELALSSSEGVEPCEYGGGEERTQTTVGITEGALKTEERKRPRPQSLEESPEESEKRRRRF